MSLNFCDIFDISCNVVYFVEFFKLWVGKVIVFLNFGFLYFVVVVDLGVGGGEEVRFVVVGVVDCLEGEWVKGLEGWDVVVLGKVVDGEGVEFVFDF